MTVKRRWVTLDGRRCGKTFLSGQRMEQVLDAGGRVAIMTKDGVVYKKRVKHLTLIETKKIDTGSLFEWKGV